MNRFLKDGGKNKASNGMAAVGFEPTPSKWLEPKSSALDHSATLPPAFGLFLWAYISLMTRQYVVYWFVPVDVRMSDTASFSQSSYDKRWASFPLGLGVLVLSTSTAVTIITTQRYKGKGSSSTLNIKVQSSGLCVSDLPWTWCILPPATWGRCSVAALPGRPVISAVLLSPLVRPLPPPRKNHGSRVENHWRLL